MRQEKEIYDIMGRSDGTPMSMQFQKVVAPYLASFEKFPHKDYWKMKRER